MARWIGTDAERRVFPPSREVLARNWFRAAARYPHPSGTTEGSSAVLNELTARVRYGSRELRLTRDPENPFAVDTVTFDAARRTPYTAAARLNSYLPQNALARYAEAFSAALIDPQHCPMCGHLAQGFDAELYGEPGVFLARGAGFALIPNRFPPSPGPFDLLLVPVSHDAPDRKTAGKRVSLGDLEAVTEACAALAMAAQRNHVLDGMSVPQHDHWKLTPLETPAGRWREMALACRTAAREAPLWQGQVPGVSFDMLGITGQDTRQVLECVATCLQRLEDAREVFTLWYADGVFAILPRWSEAYHQKPLLPPLSSAVGTLLMPPCDPKLLSTMEQRVPLAGEFDWRQFAAGAIQPAGTAPTVKVLWRDELPASLAGSTAVVIDVLAATTNMADFLAAGAELYLTNSANVLADLARLRAQGTPPLVVGETLDPGLAAQLRFDCSNDPLVIRESGLLNRLEAQPVLYLSNNGTRVVVEALERGASRVLAASFVTAGAVARSLREDCAPVVILPAGEVQFAKELREGEDFECGQYLARLVRGAAVDPARSIAATAEYVRRVYPELQPEAHRKAFAARVERYLEIVLAIDRVPIVPLCFRESGSGLIRAVNQSKRPS